MSVLRSDLRVLAALGGAPTSDPPEGVDPWQAAVVAVRARFAARRVVLVVEGRTVVSGPSPESGSLPADLAGSLCPGRRAAHWRLRDAPPSIRAALRARGAAEVLLAPLPSSDGVCDDGAVLEVHDPRRSRWRRATGRSDAAVRAELDLLAAAAEQVARGVVNDRVRVDLGRALRFNPVSGLLNRCGLLRAATVELREGPAAVATVDLALVGPVASTLGVAPAERAVALVAERLTEACGRRPGVAGIPGVRASARLEGGTFAVVVSGLARVRVAEAAGEVLERLRAHLARPYTVDGLTFTPAVTVGVATGDGTGGTGLAAPSTDVPLDGAADAGLAALLLARADVALGAARAGGPPLRHYDPGMGERADRRVAVARGFATALADGHLSVSFQPTMSLQRSTVVGVEALARWEHPELGSLPPDEFVPVLEATGRIGALTTFVLEESLAAVRTWLDDGLRLGVAVNVPAALLSDDSFPAAVAAALQRHRVPARLLTLELTETGVSSDRPAAVPALRHLRRLGCRIAVDDFGTGQSSLAHLRGLPVDQLKIDKSFVLDMDGEQGIAVVRAIVEMGHSLGLTVVAEGVERTAERDTLVALGCDVAQGYLVSRPLPASCLERWLASLDPVGGSPRVSGGGPDDAPGELLVGGPRPLRVGGAV